jgi:SAM-dependent methyltransferase
MRPLLLATLAAATVAQTVTVDVTKAVRERYEAFPYPAVKEGTDDGDVPSEYHWLRLEQLNQYNYGGKRDDFTGFKVLIAGCGTGGAVVGMAHVLREWKGAFVTALDLSAPSVATTRARLERFGFVEKEHFALHAMSLLDVAAVTAEPYDLILSTGMCFLVRSCLFI